MRRRIRKLFSILSVATLAWTASGGAEAVAHLAFPGVSPYATYRQFLRNQEKMRLETQALSEQSLSSNVLLKNRPFWTQWINPSRIFSAESPLARPIHPKFPELTWGLLGAAVSAVLLAELPRLLMAGAGSGVRLACGIGLLGFILNPLQRVRAENPGVIPDLHLPAVENTGYITQDRGQHEAGAVIRLGEALGGYRFLIVKVACDKREDLTNLLNTRIQERLTLDAKEHSHELLPEVVWVLRHYRYSTGSDPTIEEEAHPHLEEQPRQATLYALENGVAKPKQATVEMAIAHNGNFNRFKWWWHERSPWSAAQVHERLVRILDTPNDLKGDSPNIAMMLSLLRAQGDAFAAMRLAFQMMPFSATAQAPSRAALSRWNRPFQDVFVRHSAALYPPGSGRVFADPDPEALERFKDELRQSLRSELAGDPEARLLFADPATLGVFVDEAVTAFLENDLGRAMQLFAERAEGSFGLCALSTVDEDPILYSLGNPVSAARHLEEGRLAAGSEPKSFVAQTRAPAPEEDWLWDFIERLRVRPGEIVRLRSHGMAEVLHPRGVPESSPETVEKRWVRIPESSLIQPIRRTPGIDPKGPLTDLNRAAEVVDQTQEDWHKPDSSNRKTAEAIGEAFAELAAQDDPYDPALGHLSWGTHVIFAGHGNDMVYAHRWREWMKTITPHLRTEVVDTEWVLHDPMEFAHNHAVTKKTIIFNFCRSGEDFSQATAEEAFKRISEQVFNFVDGVPEDLDTEMAQALGQELDPQARLARRTIVNGAPWPKSKALVHTPIMMWIAQNCVTLSIIHAVRQVHPGGRPLGLRDTMEMMEEIDGFEEGLLRQIEQVTGVDRHGRPFPSKAHDDLVAAGRHESPSHFEMRVIKWAYWTFVTIIIYFSIVQGWLPHRLIPFLAHQRGWAWAAPQTLWDALCILGALRWGLIYLNRGVRRLPLGDRFGTRVTGVSMPEMWQPAKMFSRVNVSFSRPEAQFFAEGGDPFGDINSHYSTDTGMILGRGASTVYFRTDDRLLTLEESLGPSIDMGAGLTRVNRSLPHGKWIHRLNKQLARLKRLMIKIRIPFAHPRTIFVTQHLDASSSADVIVRLGRTYFPVPPAVRKFARELEARTGLALTPDQLADFYRRMDSYVSTPDISDSRRVAQELAAALQIPDQRRAEFVAFFLEQKFTDFEGGDPERQKRMEAWTARRLDPIIGYLAFCVFEVARVEPIADPALHWYERYDMGQIQSGTLIHTTDDNSPGTPVFRMLGQEVFLKDISVPGPGPRSPAGVRTAEAPGPSVPVSARNSAERPANEPVQTIRDAALRFGRFRRIPRLALIAAVATAAAVVIIYLMFDYIPAFRAAVFKLISQARHRPAQASTGVMAIFGATPGSRSRRVERHQAGVDRSA